SPEGARKVEALASRVKEDVARGGVVFLTGHASRPGSESFNYELSKARAETVRSELARHGVDPDKVRTSWSGEGDAKLRGAADDRDDRDDRSVTWEVVKPPPPGDRTERQLPPDLGRKVAEQFTRDKEYDPDKDGPQLVKALAKDAARPSASTIPKALYEGAQYVFKWGVDTIKTTEAFKKINEDLVPAAVNRLGELAGHQKLLPVRDDQSAYAQAGRTAGENVYVKLSDQEKRDLVEALRDPQKVSQLRYEIYDAMKNKLEGRTR
ncbi:MAG: OmpA family protein, partial [Actinomycetota bacterium]|nr:OmpA family protein [Actinomycetota bacterium]